MRYRLSTENRVCNMVAVVKMGNKFFTAQKIHVYQEPRESKKTQYKNTQARTYSLSRLIYNKCAMVIQWGKDNLQKLLLEQLGTPMEKKINLTLYIILCTKTNLK